MGSLAKPPVWDFDVDELPTVEGILPEIGNDGSIRFDRVEISPIAHVIEDGSPLVTCAVERSGRPRNVKLIVLIPGTCGHFRNCGGSVTICMN